MITKDDIRDVAELCKLNISEEEVENFRKDFSRILGYVDLLKTADTDGVEPTYHVNSGTQPLRDDMVEDSMPVEDTIQNAPEEQYGYFKLLRVMD
ncbi:MAG: Asp-tRNA(Asn)/Glu-tRNA(Gln) amidotransferase subunit GatC [Tissierellia bacterium]|nr:Asp-tRNA(Asn)/Glu-tRNA(Gln) amidotransferase subunit GatC [Tissierellia bacterium]